MIMEPRPGILLKSIHMTSRKFSAIKYTFSDSGG